MPVTAARARHIKHLLRRNAAKCEDVHYPGAALLQMRNTESNCKISKNELLAKKK
jgi:hypothetical protein